MTTSPKTLLLLLLAFWLTIPVFGQGHANPRSNKGPSKSGAWGSYLSGSQSTPPAAPKPAGGWSGYLKESNDATQAAGAASQAATVNPAPAKKSGQPAQTAENPQKVVLARMYAFMDQFKQYDFNRCIRLGDRAKFAQVFSNGLQLKLDPTFTKQGKFYTPADLTGGIFNNPLFDIRKPLIVLKEPDWKSNPTTIWHEFLHAILWQSGQRPDCGPEECYAEMCEMRVSWLQRLARFERNFKSGTASKDSLNQSWAQLEKTFRDYRGSGLSSDTSRAQNLNGPYTTDDPDNTCKQGHGTLSTVDTATVKKCDAITGISVDLKKLRDLYGMQKPGVWIRSAPKFTRKDSANAAIEFVSPTEIRIIVNPSTQYKYEGSVVFTIPPPEMRPSDAVVLSWERKTAPKVLGDGSTVQWAPAVNYEGVSQYSQWINPDPSQFIQKSTKTSGQTVFVFKEPPQNSPAPSLKLTILGDKSYVVYEWTYSRKEESD